MLCFVIFQMPLGEPGLDKLLVVADVAGFLAGLSFRVLCGITDDLFPCFLGVTSRFWLSSFLSFFKSLLRFDQFSSRKARFSNSSSRSRSTPSSWAISLVKSIIGAAFIPTSAALSKSLSRKSVASSSCSVSTSGRVTSSAMSGGRSIGSVSVCFDPRSGSYSIINIFFSISWHNTVCGVWGSSIHSFRYSHGDT